MKTYVITFSTVGIQNGWIEVTANNEAIARAWANREYVRWSSIYPIESWRASTRALFPLGCFGRTTLHYEAVEHVPASRYGVRS